ncbi:MAG: YlxM family DNA-binding protein [Lachnospiraceae bacterium]|nr:YlxM family DNA-binding protein [Lachnospiraceae bacterium]
METGNLTAREAVPDLEKYEYKGMLYDFYGELLTNHQKKIYEDAVLNDLSLGEIADEQGISRQGVHDLIRRCDRILTDYENKLHLVEKFSVIRQNIRQINNLTDDEQIRRLSNEIIEQL